MGKKAKLKQMRKIAKELPELVFEDGNPVNHHRKMKALYNKQGIQGVNNYIHIINEHAKTL